MRKTATRVAVKKKTVAAKPVAPSKKTARKKVASRATRKR
jgi:hypothetical protein